MRTVIAMAVLGAALAACDSLPEVDKGTLHTIECRALDGVIYVDSDPLRNAVERLVRSEALDCTD